MVSDYIPILHGEILENMTNKLKLRQDPIEELGIFKINLESHLNHLDGVE